MGNQKFLTVEEYVGLQRMLRQGCEQVRSTKCIGKTECVQDTHTLLQARWCAPTLSIVDVRVGDDEESSHDPFYRFGPTRFSVIPRLAVGNVRYLSFSAFPLMMMTPC